MAKTAVVAVETTKPHGRYKKMVKHTTKFKAHDEENAAKEGDLVRIEESRPLSRDKRWRVVEVVERAQ
jgi:small subunit ribosomal protein S17